MCDKSITVAETDFDMENNMIRTTNDIGDYKPGHRKETKKKAIPSKLKTGSKGLDAIVKLNK